MKIKSRQKLKFTDEQCSVIDDFLALELEENEGLIKDQHDCIAALAEESLFLAEDIAEKNEIILALEAGFREQNHIIQGLLEENIKLAAERDKMQGILERVFS